MVDLIKKIEQAGEAEMDDLLKAVLRRCRELFPDRELSVLSVQRNADKNAYLDSVVELLAGIKQQT